MIRDTLRIRKLSLCSDKTQNTKDCKDCILCEQPFRFYKRKFSLCEHAQSICQKCCQQMIDIAIQSKKLPKCPHCQAEMLTQDSEDSPSYYKHLPISEKKRFDTFLKEISNSSIKNIRFCQIIGCEGELSNGICKKCGAYYCQKCFKRDHLGKCKSQSQITDIVQTQNIKYCPKCKTLLERDGGCLQFTCGNCRHVFCFKCKQNWSPRHHACEGVVSGLAAFRGFFQQIFK